MIKINNLLLDSVSAAAKESARRRKNYNFHKESNDLLQRMLNAMEPDTYVQPHKHENPDKREAFVILRGKALIIEFDDQGNITDHVLLYPTEGQFGVEIAPKVYHTIISLAPDTVVYEIKDGPYEVAVDKGFASWAPKENSPEAPVYLKSLVNKVLSAKHEKFD